MSKKIMKRIICCLMVITCFTVLTGCGKKTPAIVGSWELESMTAGDQTINMEDLKALAGDQAADMNATLTATEDGKMTMEIMGEKTEATWTEKDGKIMMSADGEEAEVKIADGKLTVESDVSGQKASITFVKKK